MRRRRSPAHRLWYFALLASIFAGARAAPAQSLEACALAQDDLFELSTSCVDPHLKGNASSALRNAIAKVVNTCAAPGNATVASQGIRVLELDGALSAAHTQLSAAFTDATGVAVNVDIVPFYRLTGALYQTFGAPISAHAYDVFQMSPQFFGDSEASGTLLDLSPLVVNDFALQWNALPSVLRDKAMVYNGKVVALPVLVSAAVMMYRQDLFDYYQLGPPPATWQQLIALATSFNGSADPAGLAPGGVWGLCVNWDCFASFWLSAIWTGLMQTQGPAHGPYFDPVTMKPLVNNAAMRQALMLAAQIAAVNAPDGGFYRGGCGAVSVKFGAGQCLMTFNLPFDFKVISPLSSSSPVRGRLGTAPLPGSVQVTLLEVGSLALN